VNDHPGRDQAVGEGAVGERAGDPWRPHPLLDVDQPAEGILRLAMRQPAKKNALNAAMREALFERLEAAAVDPAVRAVVLTGAEGTYSAGGDLQGLQAVEPADFRAYLQRGHRLVQLLYRFEKPTVAAIEGVGVGGGLALALCCDAIVMGRSARVGFTFLRIGFVPDWGTLHTLGRRVGPARARQLFLDPQLMDAERALAIGLADEAADDGRVQDTALATAVRLAGQAPRAYALTKRLLQTLPADLDGALEAELIAQQSCFAGPEFREGVAAFLARRPPDFRRLSGQEAG